MALLAGVEPGTGQRPGEGRLSWPVFLLTLAAVTSSSLSVLSLYQLLALRGEVEMLKSDISRRREERQEPRHGGQTLAQMTNKRNIPEILGRLVSQPSRPPTRKKRQTTEEDKSFSQPCLHMLANTSRKTFQKDYDSELHTGIPWMAGLIRGSALEVVGDTMVVVEEGYFFVYSQVYYYKDSTFAMGHVVIRRKRNVVGDEPQQVVLFRCVQNMNPVYPFNTCYTGGIVKLEAGDHLELLIPRSTANVSLYGDSTFLGAFKLA
uniref:TNF superfamily member 13b n=2 Tax=Myripristis murdjan TaxID=586833 RepID=A0A667X4M8_9TELE